MSRTRGHSLERGFWLGLLGLCVCFACSSEFSSHDSGAGGHPSAGAAGTPDDENTSGGKGEVAGSPAIAGSDAVDGGSAGVSEAGRGGNHAAGAHSAGGAHSGSGGSASGSAGTSANGGTAGESTGHAGAGGKCQIMECFVENTCLDKCGGNVMYTGCCPCDPSWVNKLSCPGTH